MEQRVTGVSTTATSLPDPLITTDLRTRFLATFSLFSTEVRTATVAEDDSASGVVIDVPHCAT